MKIRKLILFFVLLSFLSCRQNPLNVNIRNLDLKISINRFEKELFGMATDTLEQGISFFSEKYTDFFDAFSYHVINIGMPGEDNFPAYLAMFLNDGLNREVYEETIKTFPDLGKLELTLSNAFKRYKYHFPDESIPVLVSYISRFNHSYFTVGKYLCVGLDKYLGVNSPYYKGLGLPLYQRQNMFREKIPSDILYAFANIEIPFNDDSDNLLGHCIHQGKLMYFLDAVLPDQPDSLKIGFTVNQMKWCRKNERGMWEYLVENKLLFSSEKMVIRKLIGPAPFTSYFTTESPGRTGVWIGWQIVRKYAKNNKDLTPGEILYEMDYQKILRGSGYNP